MSVSAYVCVHACACQQGLGELALELWEFSSMQDSNKILLYSSEKNTELIRNWVQINSFTSLSFGFLVCKLAIIPKTRKPIGK